MRRPYRRTAAEAAQDAAEIEAWLRVNYPADPDDQRNERDLMDTTMRMVASMRTIRRKLAGDDGFDLDIDNSCPF